MWDLIWKFYRNPTNIPKGLMNCFSHIIIHFAKDLFTPAGLPLLLTSLFNKYEKFKDGTVSGIRYKDSMMQKLDKYKMNIKASDFASFFLIKTFLHFYCEHEIKENEIKDIDGFKRDIRLLAKGTCISLQMALLLLVVIWL